MAFTPQTILRRMNGISLDFESVQHIILSYEGQTRQFPNNLLQILSIFAHPTVVQEAVNQLNSKSMDDWARYMDTIKQLHKLGALAEYEQHKNLPDKNPASFGSLPIHIKMLNDRPRTSTFIEALIETVKPGDVVLDIGTGTGVLAIAAARAGAAKVYAIEGGAMADVAQEVINQSDVADKIVLLRGWSTEIELPEKADVLVSEIIGNDPYAELVLQTFADARKRLLKPNAVILPGKIEVYGVPVRLPDDFFKHQSLLPVDLASWKDWYDIDFSAMLSHQSPKQVFTMLKPEKAAKVETAGAAILLNQTDLIMFESARIEKLVGFKAEKPFNGILIYFTLELGATNFSNNPWQSPEHSWLNPVWHFPELETMQADDTIRVKFEYGKAGGSVLSVAKDAESTNDIL